jgi:hypothetical protein
MVQDEILLDGICDFEQAETYLGFVAGWHRGNSEQGKSLRNLSLKNVKRLSKTMKNREESNNAG